jgi:imidazolonepropionase-like amidohydrolase
LERPVSNLIRSFTLAAITLAAFIPARAQSPTILRNATLIDGTGAPPREHVDITLRAGLIESIAPTAQSTPTGFTIVDCTGETVIPGRIPGFSEHRELEDLAASGLSPLQAITVATGSTGQLIHSLDPTLNVGLISPGYSADLIILTASPLADIRNTRHIAVSTTAAASSPTRRLRTKVSPDAQITTTVSLPADSLLVADLA